VTEIARKVEDLLKTNKPIVMTEEHTQCKILAIYVKAFFPTKTIKWQITVVYQENLDKHYVIPVI